MADIKETKEALVMSANVGKAIVPIWSQVDFDSKLSVLAAALKTYKVLKKDPLYSQIKDGISGIDKVPSELLDLSVDELKELSDMVDEIVENWKN